MENEILNASAEEVVQPQNTDTDLDAGMGEVVQPQEMNAGTGGVVQPQNETGFPQTERGARRFVGERSGDGVGGGFDAVGQNGASEVCRDDEEGNADVNSNVEETGQNPPTIYKSFETQQDYQAEIDRIIGQRLGDTRELKNRAAEYDRLSGQLQELFGTDDVKAAMDIFTQQYAEAMAAQQGTTPEAFLEHQELVSKARQLEQLQQQQTQQMQRQQRMSQIDGQVNAFKEKNPEFDMGKEVENTEFCRMIWEQGLSVEDAYYLTHKDALFKQAQTAVVNNIAANQTRIPENGAGKVQPTVNKINPDKLTFSDIDSILERVSNGEKIQF